MSLNDREFTQPPYSMICGSAEAEKHRYHIHVDKSGKRWLVADQPDCASNVYVEGGPNSNGFGGRELSFTLVDGSILKLKGPWHTNADSLFQATGVDVRDKYLTYGVVAEKREYRKKDGGMRATLISILHQDAKPVIGKFNRIQQIALGIAKKLNQTVQYYSESAGGSSCGPISPTDVERD